MNFKLHCTLLLTVFFVLSCKKTESRVSEPEKNIVTAPEKYVFATDNLKRYQFPTHINDLIIDRAFSSCSEVFMVIVEPGKTVFHHKHDDTEQVFYMLKGNGLLLIGEPKKEYVIKPGYVVRIPVSTLHSVQTIGNDTIQYLCVDCFGKKQLEPTWDEHVQVVCKNNGWDYNEVVTEN